LRAPPSAAGRIRPPPTDGSLRPLPEDGPKGDAPIDSRVSVEALAKKLLFLTSGTRWATVSWCVAPEAGPGPECVQSSDLTTMTRCALELVLLFLRASPSAAGRIRPPSTDGSLRPLPEDGPKGAAPIDSRVSVEALAKKLFFLTSGTRWATVSLCVALEAGPGPECVQSSDLTTMTRCALELVLLSSHWPTDMILSYEALIHVLYHVIGVQLCSSMNATFLQRNFLVKLNSPSFF